MQTVLHSKLSVIKTDAQYREYLSEIEQLIALDPEPSSPEGKHLELLALLVETYEKERYRIPLPNPIDAILFRLEQKGLQQKDLVPIIGSKGRVSEVLSGKRRLTIPMVRKLSAQLEIPASVLIGEPQQQADQLEEAPPVQLVREIVKRGWVGGSGKVTSKNASDFVARLFRKLGVPTVGPAYLRGSIHAGLLGPVDLYAIRLWIARVLIKSRAYENVRGKFRREAISETMLIDLARLSWFENGPAIASEYLAKVGIVMVVEKHLPGTGLDGSAMLDADGTPVIGLTLRHDRLDNFWFTLLHECAHVIKHLQKPGETFVDDTEKPYDVDEKEVEANRMARDSLIPQHIWRQSDANRLKTISAIMTLAEELKISPAIIAGRIRRETGNYRLFASLIGHRGVSKVLSS